MKKFVVLFLLSLLCIDCHGQDQAKEPTKNNQNMAKEPKGNWKVNREFDEQGNLIRYDSIYSWSSSEYAEKLNRMDRDSLFSSFKSRFSHHFSYFDQSGLIDFLENDSLFTQKFFEDDFFKSPMGKDFINLESMHQRMEEIHRKFMGQYIPEVKENTDQQI